ncbi:MULTISPECIES: hypothetical protein [unclassified Streptomyces]|uniref:hypothetical protein n=1 Tax=unclassified Streptomyces TaxID=2593676 RepID=UPI0034204756
MNEVVLAGKFADMGDSFIATLARWSDSGLKAILLTVVVVTVGRKFSMKAGIGALIALVAALAIYNPRRFAGRHVLRRDQQPFQGRGRRHRRHHPRPRSQHGR